MARKKDLAGLATLAGLAYMASRDKEGKSAAPEAKPESAVASPVASSAGDVEETKLDSMADVPRSRPAAPKAPTPKPTAKPMGGSGRGGQGGASAEELTAYAASKKPAYETPYDRMNRENREQGKDIGSVVESLKNRIATAGDRGSALPLKSTKADKNEFMGAGMKKGGSVKGWGIARGSRKAKTY